MTDKDLLDGLEKIYNDEQNARIDWLWDAGFNVYYGDTGKAYTWSDNAYSLRDALERLINTHNKESK